jgi:transcriptional regulator with XRE-family HTH domain
LKSIRFYVTLLGSITELRRMRLERLRHIREQAGYSQQDLADESGVSQHTISELELGRRRPQGRTLRKLAKVLGVEVADLREDTDSPKAEAPPSSIQPPLNGFEDERRVPTPSERRAVGALEDRCKHFAAVLETARRGGLEIWRLESDYALDIAALVLPLIEQDHLRPLLRPVAARFVGLVYAVLDGMKDAGAAEEAERRRERFVRIDREIA